MKLKGNLKRFAVSAFSLLLFQNLRESSGKLFKDTDVDPGSLSSELTDFGKSHPSRQDTKEAFSVTDEKDFFKAST